MQESGVVRAHIDDELGAMDMAPEDVVAGNPRVRTKVLEYFAPDGTPGYTGIFAAEPGAVRSPLATAETLHVLEGQMRAENPDGVSVTMKAGDVVVLPAGEWTYTFESTFRTVFASGAGPRGDGADA